MNKVCRYFNVAKKIAESGDSKDAKRRYRLGAVGIRLEGTLVVSSNISTRRPHRNVHAESRVTKKLNAGSVVYVVRISRRNKVLLLYLRK